MKRLAIVGAGMATARLLKELSGYSHEYKIDVFGEESHACYNRVLLSSVLCGEKSATDLKMLDEDAQDAQRITLHKSEKVVAIDTVNKTLTTSAGKTVAWDELVIATGSRASVPAIAGIVSDNVHVFRNLNDLKGLFAAARGARKAVVIGGGLLGLEAAIGLNGLGIKTTVVNRQSWIMPRQLDETAGGLLQEQIAYKGIAFALGSSPHSLRTSEGKASAVVLANGDELPCDLVVVATGITPNKELALEAGIACDQAVIVSPHMETSATGVYALGECCEIGKRTFGLVAPINIQAEILAWNLAHAEKRQYRYEEPPVHLKISGIHVVTAGEFPYPENSQSQVVFDPDGGVYRRLVFSNDQLIGYQLVGDKAHNAWYYDLLRNQSTISDCRSSMMFCSQLDEPQLRVA